MFLLRYIRYELTCRLICYFIHFVYRMQTSAQPLPGYFPTSQGHVPPSGSSEQAHLALQGRLGIPQWAGIVHVAAPLTMPLPAAPEEPRDSLLEKAQSEIGVIKLDEIATLLEEARGYYENQQGRLPVTAQLRGHPCQGVLSQQFVQYFLTESTTEEHKEPKEDETEAKDNKATDVEVQGSVHKSRPRYLDIVHAVVIGCFEQSRQRFAQEADWPFTSEQEFYDECHRFGESLALVMLTQEPKTFVADTSHPAYADLFGNALAETADAHSGRRSWFVVQSLPLRRLGGTFWAFAHPSLWEYFYARTTVPPAYSAPAPHLGQMDITQFVQNLGVMLFTQDMELLRMHTQLMRDNPSLKPVYVAVVLASRHKHPVALEDTRLCVAASNAISVLNYGHLSGEFVFHFSDVGYWKGIRVPHANLNRAQLVSCNLDDADLTNATMIDALLHGSSLRGAKLNGVYTRLKAVYSDHIGREVQDVAASPDDSMLVTASYYTIALIKSDGLRRTVDELPPEIHKWCVSSLAFSPDGKTLAAAGKGGVVRLIDLATRSLKKAEDKSISLGVRKTYFIPDGSGLVCVPMFSKKLYIFNPNSLESLCQPLEHEGYIVDFCMSPDQKTFLTADTKGLTLWVWFPPEPIARIEDCSHSSICSACFNWDGRLILTGHEMGEISIWDVSMQDRVATLFGHRHEVKSLRLSPDGRLLLSVSSDGSARIWDLATYRCVGSMRGHMAPISGACWIPSKSSIATVSHDSLLRIWDATPGECSAPQEFPRTHITRFALSRDSSILAAALAREHAVWIWDFNTGSLKATLKSRKSYPVALTLSNDNQVLVVSTEDNYVSFWDLTTMECVSQSREHEQRVSDVAITPDGRRLYSWGADDSVCVWDMATRKVIARITNRGARDTRLPSLSFSPDSEMVLIANGSRLEIYHTQKRTRMNQFQGCQGGKISPCGAYVAGVSSQHISLIHLKTQMFVKRFETERGHPPCLSWSPDSQLLAGCPSDKVIAVWDVQSGRRVATVAKHKKTIQWLEFTPDGKYLVSCAEDGFIFIWSVSSKPPESGSKVDVKLHHVIGRYGLDLDLVDFSNAHMDETFATLVKALVPEASVPTDGVSKLGGCCSIA